MFRQENTRGATLDKMLTPSIRKYYGKLIRHQRIRANFSLSSVFFFYLEDIQFFGYINNCVLCYPFLLAVKIDYWRTDCCRYRIRSEREHKILQRKINSAETRSLFNILNNILICPSLNKIIISDIKEILWKQINHVKNMYAKHMYFLDNLLIVYLS